MPSATSLKRASVATVSLASTASLSIFMRTMQRASRYTSRDPDPELTAAHFATGRQEPRQDGAYVRHRQPCSAAAAAGGQQQVVETPPAALATILPETHLGGLVQLLSSRTPVASRHGGLPRRQEGAHRLLFHRSVSRFLCLQQ